MSPSPLSERAVTGRHGLSEKRRCLLVALSYRYLPSLFSCLYPLGSPERWEQHSSITRPSRCASSPQCTPLCSATHSRAMRRPVPSIHFCSQVVTTIQAEWSRSQGSMVACFGEGRLVSTWPAPVSPVLVHMGNNLRPGAAFASQGRRCGLLPTPCPRSQAQNSPRHPRACKGAVATARFRGAAHRAAPSPPAAPSKLSRRATTTPRCQPSMGRSLFPPPQKKHRQRLRALQVRQKSQRRLPLNPHAHGLQDCGGVGRPSAAAMAQKHFHSRTRSAATARLLPTSRQCPQRCRRQWARIAQKWTA